MPDEIPTPAPETPEVPAAPVGQPQGSPVQTPPPAARLVVEGVKSEREIELERALETERDRAKRAEVIAAEAERKAQELLQIPKPPAPPKEKRKRNWSDPVFSDDDETE